LRPGDTSSSATPSSTAFGLRFSQQSRILIGGYRAPSEARCGADGDVLYLHVGSPKTAVDFDESTEGHHLRWDAHGQLVGITILNARRHLEHDSKITLSLPDLEIEASDLEGVLTPA
jgi:YD repeat-containing protein